jgi:hypothetical protein
MCKKHWAGEVTQVVEHQPSKRESLNWSHSTAKVKKACNHQALWLTPAIQANLEG